MRKVPTDIHSNVKRTGIDVFLIALILILIATPTLAWFYVQRNLVAYVPISAPEALYIGAGHKESDHFEDIRYMYFNGIDTSERAGY